MDGVVITVPSANYGTGTYTATQSVTLSATGASSIHYTTNGTDPTCTSGTTISGSSGSLSVASSQTVKALSCYANGNHSTIAPFVYTIQCAITSVDHGSVAAYSSCAITCNSGYTLSGSTCVASGGGGGGGGGDSSAPTSVTTIGSGSITVPMSVDSTQIGNLTQSLSDGSIVELDVPKGAVTAQTTFSATAGSLTSSMTPLNTTGALMVGNQVFNITATSNNVAVRNFSGNLTISLTVPNLPADTLSLGVYYFNDTTNEWNLVPGAVFDAINNKVTFSVNHLTKFSVFNILGLPFLIKTASASTVVTPPVTPTPPVVGQSDQIKNIVAEAATISGRDVAQVLAAVGLRRDTKAEVTASLKYTTKLVSGLKNITAEIKATITNFVNYGTPTTRVLGAGERAGVISSYRSAYGKVPSTAAEWLDVIKISNGRWPSVTSASAEAQAALEFKKVYKRSPNMKNANDNAAVTVIAYGLRPANRNTNSEKAAIKSFTAVYGHAPINALAWDIVRAIAYSGAKR